MRFGGKHFTRDEDFFQSGIHEANRLREIAGLSLAGRLLEVGCGPGRLPIGILQSIGEIDRYTGIDVSRRSVEWCQRHISGAHSSFEFRFLNIYNERYNPTGEHLGGKFRFPVKEKDFDLVYLYSVFSHMETDDLRVYLSEFERLLKPNGHIFLTAFLEEGGPEIEINPQGYRRNWSGALHCVKFNKCFFIDLLAAHGFEVERFLYETETDGQSAVIARSNK